MGGFRLERYINGGLRLVLSRRRRNVDFNAIDGVGVFRGRGIKLCDQEFARGMFVEDPQRLPGDSVALGGDAAAIAENENRGYGRFLGGERCA